MYNLGIKIAKHAISTLAPRRKRKLIGERRKEGIVQIKKAG